MSAPTLLRTSLEIDEKLLREAMELSNTKIKKRAIENALKEFIERRKQKDLYDLFESDEQLIADDYDYKSARGGKLYDFG